MADGLSKPRSSSSSHGNSVLSHPTDSRSTDSDKNVKPPRRGRTRKVKDPVDQAVREALDTFKKNWQVREKRSGALVSTPYLAKSMQEDLLEALQAVHSDMQTNRGGLVADNKFKRDLRHPSWGEQLRSATEGSCASYSTSFMLGKALALSFAHVMGAQQAVWFILFAGTFNVLFAQPFNAAVLAEGAGANSPDGVAYGNYWTAAIGWFFARVEGDGEKAKMYHAAMQKEVDGILKRERTGNVAMPPKWMDKVPNPAGVPPEILRAHGRSFLDDVAFLIMSASFYGSGTLGPFWSRWTPYPVAAGAVDFGMTALMGFAGISATGAVQQVFRTKCQGVVPTAGPKLNPALLQSMRDLASYDVTIQTTALQDLRQALKGLEPYIDRTLTHGALRRELKTVDVKNYERGHELACTRLYGKLETAIARAEAKLKAKQAKQAMLNHDSSFRRVMTSAWNNMSAANGEAKRVSEPWLAGSISTRRTMAKAVAAAVPFITGALWISTMVLSVDAQAKEEHAIATNHTGGLIDPPQSAFLSGGSFGMIMWFTWWTRQAVVAPAIEFVLAAAETGIRRVVNGPRKDQPAVQLPPPQVDGAATITTRVPDSVKTGAPTMDGAETDDEDNRNVASDIDDDDDNHRASVTDADDLSDEFEAPSSVVVEEVEDDQAQARPIKPNSGDDDYEDDEADMDDDGDKHKALLAEADELISVLGARYSPSSVVVDDPADDDEQ